MKLTALDLQRSRGLACGYKLDGLSPGFNVIVGANGSGKSSLCRAVAALLWETEDFQGAAQGSWDVGGRQVSVLRESGAAPQWTGDGQPALPEKRFRGCFSFSVDEFFGDEDTEAEIERAIRTELLAGFDLSQVLPDRRSNPNTRTASGLKSALVESRRKREELAGSHEDLLFQEQKLDEKKKTKAQAGQAGERVLLLEQALELANKRVELATAVARLGEFPPSMDALRSDSRKFWESCQAQVTRCEEELRRAEDKLRGAQGELQAADLQAPVEADQLQLLSRREQTLRALDEEVRASHQGEAVAAARVQEARQALKGLNQDASDGADRFAGLEGLIQKLAELEARLFQADEQLAAARESVQDDVPDAPYTEGLALLGRWMRSESSSPIPTWLPRALAVAGLILGALPWVLALALPAATGSSALLVALAIWLRRQSRGAGRAVLEEEYARLFPGEPQEWQPHAVAQRIEQLQSALARKEAQRLAAEGLQRAERQHRRLQEEHGQALAELQGMGEPMGLAADSSRLRLSEVADQLRRQIQANHDFAEATALRDTARARRSSELKAVNTVLERFQMAPVDNVEDLRAAQTQLESRENRRRSASEAIQESERAIASLKDQLAGAQRAREEFLTDLNLGEEAERELLRRLDRLDEWGEAQGNHMALEREVANLEKRLEAHPELLGYDGLRAQTALEESRELAARLQPLNEEVAALTNKIERAQAGHEMTDALDEEARRREELSDLRDELLEGAAADLLLDSVAREHQELSQPDILRNAAELFAKFTRHRYELLTASYSEKGLPFEVRETDGGKKELTELSSGTRTQLGLALRVAVARSVELDEPLPLVLDEALTNSDPERFREVIRSLNEMVELGRQILFLTSDPADAARLEEVLKELDAEPARTYDLDAMRGEARAAEDLRTEPLPAVPAPLDGESAEEYAGRLRVPRMDVFAGVDALHLHYLCGGDTRALHLLLRERIETVGKARHYLQSAKGVWTEDQIALLEARRDVAAAWLDHYKIGRAPRLYPEVLREGPLAKGKFIEDLIAINEELGGRARALMEAIDAKAKDRDPRLKGFKKSKRDELQEDLEKRGLLTEDEVLSAADRRERCLAAGRRHLERGVVTREDLVQLANAFEQWVGPKADTD